MRRRLLSCQLQRRSARSWPHGSDDHKLSTRGRLTVSVSYCISTADRQCLHLDKWVSWKRSLASGGNRPIAAIGCTESSARKRTVATCGRLNNATLDEVH